jgi:Flp pilus assembly pilin Flp
VEGHLEVPFKKGAIEMVSRFRCFWRDRAGTDLVEYTLLLAFICLASAAAYIGVGQTTSQIWAITNTRLASAASAANTGS